MARTFSLANLAFTYCNLASVHLATCLLPLLKFMYPFSKYLLNSGHWGWSRNQDKAPTFSVLNFQRDYLDIRLNDLLQDPHLSLFVALNTLSHLLVYGMTLWFSSHHSACLLAPYYVTFLAPCTCKVFLWVAGLSLFIGLWSLHTWRASESTRMFNLDKNNNRKKRGGNSCDYVTEGLPEEAVSAMSWERCYVSQEYSVCQQVSSKQT